MTFVDYIRDFFASQFDGVVRDIERETRRVVFTSLHKVSRYIFLKLFSAIIILIAIVFISLAAVFFLIDFVHLGRVISLLIVGIFFLIIGLIIKFIH